MKGKMELIRITEVTEHNRKVLINLEKELANLNEKHTYEPEKKRPPQTDICKRPRGYGNIDTLTIAQHKNLSREGKIMCD